MFLVSCAQRFAVPLGTSPRASAANIKRCCALDLKGTSLPRCLNNRNLKLENKTNFLLYFLSRKEIKMYFNGVIQAILDFEKTAGKFDFFKTLEKIPKPTLYLGVPAAGAGLGIGTVVATGTAEPKDILTGALTGAGLGTGALAPVLLRKKAPGLIKRLLETIKSRKPTIPAQLDQLARKYPLETAILGSGIGAAVGHSLGTRLGTRLEELTQ